MSNAGGPAEDPPPMEVDRGRERPENHSNLDFGSRNLDSGPRNLGESPRNLGVSPRNLSESFEIIDQEIIEQEVGEMTEYERAVNFGTDANVNQDQEIVFRGALNAGDLECLKKYSGPESWLNDNVIMNYLINELPKIDPEVMIVEINVWRRTEGIPRDSARIFCPELGMKENWSKVIIPIFVKESHWTLATVDRDGRCDFYDSMEGGLSDNQKNFIREIMIYLQKEDIEFNEVDPETYYQQNNDHSCGPAVCMLAERVLKRESLDFKQGHVNNWRKRALKILRDEVLAKQTQEAESENEIEVEEIEQKVSQKKGRKRKGQKLTLEESDKQRSKVNSNNYANMSNEQRYERNKKKTVNKQKQRADPVKRAKENEQINKSQKVRRATKKQKEKKNFVARTEIEDEKKILYFDVGDLTDECKYCGARYFKGEHVTGTKKGEYNKCCNFGKVKLEDAFDDYPPELYNLIAKEHSYGRKKKGEDKDLSKLFHENPRNYNSAFAFASMRAPNQDKTTLPYAYRIQGQIHHTINLALHPDEEEDPSYAQLFYIDTEEAIEKRMENKANKKCDERVMRKIDQVLHNVNPYYHSFQMLSEVEREMNEEAEREGKQLPELRLVFDVNEADKKRFSMPRANEVAAVFVLNDNDEFLPAQKLAIHQKGKKLTKLSKFEKRAESMLYPIYFPTGKGGWNTEMRKAVGNRKVTLSEYIRFQTAIRMPSTLIMSQRKFDYANKELYGKMIAEKDRFPINAHKWNKKFDDDFELKNFNPIRLIGKLCQQYLVDAYVKIEQDRLDFIKYNQKQLKAENYKALNDYLKTTADEQGKKVGKTVILPSSFKGSPRSCQQGYQDSMALVRRKGKPDLFITFTCNPTWPEITRNLQPGNKPIDEPDLVCRVFNLKLRELLKDLKEREIFGKIAGYTYVVEFQKRGLPHAHILLILDKENKIRTPEEIDETVCAEIPDEKKFPRLHAIITSNMIHGPCGALNMNCVCMEEDKDGKKKCCKDYPKEFREETETGNDSYANYRRRKDGEVYEMPNGIEVDNKWIVLYNKYLSLKYAAHINVEICASIKCVKYLYKYVYKGHDKARMVVSVNGNDEIVHDEVKRYVDMRYVTPHEAFWRIFDLTLDEKSHAVTRLDLHLPDQQIVYYKPGEDIKEKLAKAETKHTTLTAWFELNKENEKANEFYYYEIPEKFTFKKNEDNSNMIWGKKGGEKEIIRKPCIGRMYTAHPSQGELFYLRLILLHVKGAKSWKDLLTVDGHECENFEEAARKMGLIEDEKEWENYFEEAVTYATAPKLRELFVSILNHGEQLNVKGLWERFKEDMYEDFVYKGNNEERAEQLAKVDIEKQLQQVGKSLADYEIELPNIVVEDEEFWNLEEERAIGNQMREQMNEQQAEVTNYVFEKIEELKQGKLRNGCIYVDGPGGSGKTYSYQTWCHLLRAERIRYKTSSYMGIAANLMLDGRTMHKTFALPFNLDKNSSSNAKPNNKVGKELMETDVFIIDEISMVPKHALELIDRKLRELTGKELPFGGKIMIIGGDFRQILPIQRKGGREASVSLSVRFSKLWNQFKVFKLKKNQRVLTVVEGDESVMQAREDFAEWVLKVGNGDVKMDKDEYIEIPETIIAKEDLIEEVFGEYIRANDLEGMSNRVILTTTNDKAREINENILELMEDQNMKVYYSVDTVDTDEPSCVEYPTEFLNSLKESGLPPHELKLKKNCPVMLKRNLNPAIGLCNGTRLRVKVMHKNMLECEYMFGPRTGQRVFIPRITLTSSEGTFPFTLYRKQFPVQLCFAMTINKSQGQTIDFVGLDMEEPVFGHGMTYVGVSRVRNWNSLRIAVNPAKENKIKNIVWKEVLLDNDEDEEMRSETSSNSDENMDVD